MAVDRQFPAAVMAYLCGYWDGEGWRASNITDFESETHRLMYSMGYKRALFEFAARAEQERPDDLSGLASEVRQALFSDGIVNPCIPPSIEGTIIRSQL